MYVYDTPDLQIEQIFASLDENIFAKMKDEEIRDREAMALESKSNNDHASAISDANDSFCHNESSAVSGSAGKNKDGMPGSGGGGGEFRMEDGVYVKGNFRSGPQIFTNMSSYITAYLEHSSNKTFEYKVDVQER